MGLYETFHPAVLLWSLLWGVYIYAGYEVFRLIRCLLNNKRWVCIICDIVFMVLSAVAVFLFALAYNFGELRLYMLGGMLASFIALRLTVGRFVFAPMMSILQRLIKKTEKTFIILKKVFVKLLKSAVFLVYNLVNKCRIRFSMKKGSQ